MQKLIVLSFILLFSCKNKPEIKVTVQKTVDTSQNIMQIIDVKKDTILLEEFFVDSVNIGKKSFNKIELSKYRIADSGYVLIKFYSKQNRNWILKSEYNFENNNVTGLNTELSDFNNDELNDMTYISAMGARGANELRRLFIYDRQKDQLICIKNFDEYPNILYNKELNCLDAFLVYGGCSTVFLKISGDSLKEFASVQLSDGLTIRRYDKNGREKIVFQDSTNKAGYIRYKNFKPLKEYDEY